MPLTTEPLACDRFRVVYRLVNTVYVLGITSADLDDDTNVFECAGTVNQAVRCHSKFYFINVLIQVGDADMKVVLKAAFCVY